jgi:hypothetical protein
MQLNHLPFLPTTYLVGIEVPLTEIQNVFAVQSIGLWQFRLPSEDHNPVVPLHAKRTPVVLA